jgi:hypothetical protein
VKPTVTGLHFQPLKLGITENHAPAFTAVTGAKQESLSVSLQVGNILTPTWRGRHKNSRLGRAVDGQLLQLCCSLGILLDQASIGKI